MIGSIILYLSLLTLVMYDRGKGKILSKLGFKEEINIGKESAIAVLFTGALLIGSIIVSLAFMQAGMTEDLQKAPEVIKNTPIIQVLIVLLLGSFSEEIFFRGYLQPKTSIWTASFIFAFFHIIYGSLAEVTGAFILGMILGYEYKKTKGVFSPIISHILYNLLIVASVTAI